MGKYDDIILCSRPVSTKHAPMSRENRAAQFSPFAALTGHEAAIVETARRTETFRQLDDDAIEEINRVLEKLERDIDMEPLVEITYFVPDERKEGGNYMTIVERVVKIDAYMQALKLASGEWIPIAEVYKIFPCERTGNCLQ